MPDQTGKLTPEEQKKIIDKLNGLQRDGKCEFCGKEEWHLADLVLAPVRIGGGGNWELGGEMLPCVAMVCRTCGNTKLFNAIMLGLDLTPKEAADGKK